MSTPGRHSSSARLGVVLFALAALMSFGVSFTLAAPPFTTNLDVDSVDEFTVTVSGTADSPSNATHHMEIAWGDGNVDILPDFDTDAPWNWGPVSHIYAEAGDYTITTTLIHASDQGNDRGTASDAADVTVPGPCTEDCPTEDGTTDDGTTDDGSTDGTTDDGSTDGTTDGTVPTEVLPKVIKKKPLAKTGPETAGLTVFALVLLMAGATIRMIATGDEAVATAGANSGHGDVIRQAIRRRSRDRVCNS